MSFRANEIVIQANEYLRELPPAPKPFDAPSGLTLSGWIDHTLQKPDVTAAQIKKLCEEAYKHHFATVCVNPVYVPLANGLLRDKGVGVCSVVGFPLGASFPETKAEETKRAIEMGAGEIDMVINIGAMKTGAYEMVYHDVRAVVEATEGKAHVKVILEMCYLDQREKIVGCLLCKAAGADFVKTSTGFGPSGATVDDVLLMRRVVGTEMGVKAAGGIRTLKDALAMIAAGANRLGASAGVSILREIEAE